MKIWLGNTLMMLRVLHMIRMPRGSTIKPVSSDHPNTQAYAHCKHDDWKDNGENKLLKINEFILINTQSIRSGILMTVLIFKF